MNRRGKRNIKKKWKRKRKRYLNELKKNATFLVNKLYNDICCTMSMEKIKFWDDCKKKYEKEKKENDRRLFDEFYFGENPF